MDIAHKGDTQTHGSFAVAFTALHLHACW